MTLEQSQEQLQELVDIAKRRFNLQDYIQRFGASPAQHSGDEWKLACPRCGKEKLIVNVESRMWHCWVCYQRTPPDEHGRWRVLAGAGSVVELVMELEGLDRTSALSRVLSGVHWRQGELEQIPELCLKPMPTLVPLAAPTISMPEGAQTIVDGDMEYLVKRGITRDDVVAFGLFVCRWGRYAGRLMFPVYEDGRLVYFQGRAMREAYPGETRFLKSLNPPANGCAPSSDVLMNLDVARRFPRVAVTEGPIDCVHAGPSSVCTFGKRISPTQMGKLLHNGVTALDLMWDADAIQDMEAALPMLKQYFDVRMIRLPEGDPGTYPRAQLDAWRAQARSSVSPLCQL